MPQISDYYNMAKVVSSKMDNSLACFFDDYMSRTGGIEIQAQMADWVMKAKSCEQYSRELSFLNYIWFILSSENSEYSKEPRDKYNEKRRQARFYWTRVIKQEKKDAFSKGFIRDDCNSYFDLLKISNNDDMRRYRTEEEYLNVRYDSCMAWGSTSSSNLIAFPQIFHLKQKKIADYFFIDCAFKAFDYIEQKLNGNVVNGYYLILPQLANEGLFALSTYSKAMEPLVKKDSVLVVDDVNERYTTIVDKVEGDFSAVVDNGTQNELIASLVKKGKITLTNDVLNAVDQAVFSHVYTRFSVEDLNQGAKTFSLMPIVKSVYGGRPKRANYIHVIESFKKLAKYKIEYRETNSRGDLVSAGIFSFWDLVFKTGELSDGDAHTDVAIIDGTSQQNMDILDILSSVKDLSALGVEVMPSQHIKNELRNKMNKENIKILTSLYEEELSSKAKKMLAFLVEERTSIYPACSCSLPYETFVAKLRLEEPRKKRLLEQIRGPIGQLKEHNVLVKDFTMNEYSVDITFVPIDDTERYMYKLGDTFDVIDAGEG